MSATANIIDVVIIGAGAAGLMCAIEAARRGRQVLVLDHAKKPAEKIRISGGGRCNFTNLHTDPARYLSSNPKFCISALSRYTPQDFIALVKRHNIAYHEKTLGQLFCDGSSREIITMLLTELREAGAALQLACDIHEITRRSDGGYRLKTSHGQVECTSLVVACGGKSIPKMGATGFGYKIAEQFGVPCLPTRAGLVPFILQGDAMEAIKALSGVSASVQVQCGKQRFNEAMLFTHRGISGPAILQISSYWQEGQAVRINFMPQYAFSEWLREQERQSARQQVDTALGSVVPKRLAGHLCERARVSATLAEFSKKARQALAEQVHEYTITPHSTEGYRTAEVTLGGVDTKALDSHSMECRTVSGLYFIGEVVDVTGHLGGYNFQWAWASGAAAGRHV